MKLKIGDRVKSKGHNSISIRGGYTPPAFGVIVREDSRYPRFDRYTVSKNDLVWVLWDHAQDFARPYYKSDLDMWFLLVKSPLDILMEVLQ